MTRRVMGTAAAPPFEDVEFYLEFGQLNSGEPEFTDEQLEAAWRSYGSKIMAEWSPGRPGHRPWTFWREFGEANHEDRVVFLAERGLLSEEEIGALAKARTWKHIDTGAEHTDPAAVELYERVCEALR